MAVADSEYEFSYNGLLLGANTPYELIEVQGLDPPDIRESSTDIMQGHGQFVYADYITGRRILIQGDAHQLGSQVQPLMNAWSAAFLPQSLDLPLQFKLPGQAVERIYCKPTKRKYVVDRMYALDYAEWALELLAADPRIYSDTLATLMRTGNGNLSLPNTGTFPAPLIINLVGPIDTPTITHVETGKFIKLNTNIAANTLVSIDFATRTIWLNGASLYSVLDDTSKWFELAVGVNTLTLAGTSTVATTSVIDTVTRANSTTSPGTTDTGQAWVVGAGTFGVLSNQLYKVATDATHQIIHINMTATNHIATATLHPNGGSVGVVARYVDVNNYYLVQLNGGTSQLELWKLVAGVFTSLGVYKLPIADISRVGISALGTTISAFLNGKRVISVVDSSHTTGTRTGIDIVSLVARVDDVMMSAGATQMAAFYRHARV